MSRSQSRSPRRHRHRVSRKDSREREGDKKRSASRAKSSCSNGKHLPKTVSIVCQGTASPTVPSLSLIGSTLGDWVDSNVDMVILNDTDWKSTHKSANNVYGNVPDGTDEKADRPWYWHH